MSTDDERVLQDLPVGAHTGGSLPLIRSLGVLSLGEVRNLFLRRRDELLELAGNLAEEDRAGVAAYLRKGAVIFAAMEHTSDIIFEVFETPGGSGLLTDGRYYWRLDSADYVEHYGVALPLEFIEYARRSDWNPPVVSRDRLLKIDRYLMRLSGRR